MSGISVMITADSDDSARATVEKALRDAGRTEPIIYVSEPWAMPGDAPMVEVVVESPKAAFLPPRSDKRAFRAAVAGEVRRLNRRDTGPWDYATWMSEQKGYVG